MTIRSKVAGLPDLILVYILYYRKEIISSVILFGLFVSIIFLGVENWATQLISTFGVVILATDYRIVKMVYEPLYNWIEHPSLRFPPDEAIKNALDIVRVNYHAKKYDEIGNPEMAIIKSNGHEIGVNSTNTHHHLTDGMIFQIYFEETVTHSGNQLSAPRRLGLARVKEVTDTVSWLEVIRWNNDHPSQQRSIRRGKLNGLNAYTKAKMSKEVQNSNIEELEDAYQSIRTIHHNRESVPT